MPAVLGYDVSGVLEAVGEGVEGWSVGDEVYYTVPIMGGMGTNAEYTVTHASSRSQTLTRGWPRGALHGKVVVEVV